MSDVTIARSFSLTPDQGEAYWVLGSHWNVKAGGDRTRKAYTMVETLLLPGGEPPPHTHRLEDEALYLLEGALSFRVGEERFEAGPGGFVFMPKDILHGFTLVEGVERARGLFIFSPPGIEGFFRGVGQPGEVHAPAPSTSPEEHPPPPEVVELIERHGIEFAQ